LQESQEIFFNYGGFGDCEWFGRCWCDKHNGDHQIGDRLPAAVDRIPALRLQPAAAVAVAADDDDDDGDISLSQVEPTKHEGLAAYLCAASARRRLQLLPMTASGAICFLYRHTVMQTTDGDVSIFFSTKYVQS
jgi:hypothetical protein